MPSGPTHLRELDSTRWSIVLTAANRGSLESDEALQMLCCTYWPALYTYACRQFTDIHVAQDMTQSFFARLLEKNYLKDADCRRGKFRTFLLVAFRHFLSKEWDKARARKRGGHLKKLSLDFDSISAETLSPIDNQTPEQIFDRAWAHTLTGHVVSLLRQEYESAGKAPLFDALAPFLVASPDGPSYERLANRLKLSRGAVRVAVHRLRRRYGERLREQIAETVESDDEIEDEIRDLFVALGS